MGVIELDGAPIVVTLAAMPDDGSFESGQAMLSEIAGWATENLAAQLPAAAGC